MAKEKDFDNSLLVNQHKFLFTYRPSLDQLRIQVKQARYKSDKNAEKYWSEIDGTSKGKIYNYGDKFVDPFKEVGIAPDDMGKVIGRQGRIAKEIRTVVRSYAQRTGVKVSVDIVD